MMFAINSYCNICDAVDLAENNVSFRGKLFKVPEKKTACKPLVESNTLTPALPVVKVKANASVQVSRRNNRKFSKPSQNRYRDNSNSRKRRALPLLGNSSKKLDLRGSVSEVQFNEKRRVGG